MAKTAFEKQLFRLNALKCPIHGHSMKVYKGDLDSTRPYIYECHVSACEVRGTAENESGPITLDEEFSYLVDSNIGQLPMQTYSQERGLRAADIVSIALSKIAFVHRVETGSDIGIDFICEFRHDRKPTGKIFNIQCKALPISFDDGEESISFQIKVSTARYWLEQSHPTILMVADVDSGTLYWQDPMKALTENRSAWRMQAEVSIVVPKENSFSCFDVPPRSLIEIATRGTARVGTSLRERFYTVEKIIDTEIETGVNRDSKDVAHLLLQEGTPISEALSVIESITEFQKVVFTKVTLMIASISTTMRKLHEDTFRKLHSLENPNQLFTNDPSFVEECDLLDNADAFASAGTTFTNTAQLTEAIGFLRALEDLHRTILSREVEFENYFEKLRQAYDSGINVPWPTEI